MLTGKERQKILKQWNETQTSYPRDLSIHQVFEEIAATFPNQEAVEYGDLILSYEELNRRSNQLAHYLIELGVKSETPVGICLERSANAIIALLAVLKAGGAYVPIDPYYPLKRIQYLTDDSGVSLVLSEQSLNDRFSAFSGKLLFIDDLQAQLSERSDANPECGTKATDMAYVIYTSGSTGQPKGSAILHRGVVRLVKNTNYLEFHRGDVFMQFASISFDASTFEIWGCLLNGGKLVIVPPGKPGLDELGEIILKKKVSILWLTTGLFHLMVDQKIEALTQARAVLTGGDVLSAQHARRFFEQTDHQYMINAYGPTENTAFTTCYRLTPDTDFSKPIPIGSAIANTTVYILDENQEPVAPGTPGELYTGGDGLAREYLGRSELSAEKFVANPFSDQEGDRLYRTGDLVSWRGDGNIDFLGRIDQQVKIRGYRIELGELETAIAEHPHVGQAVVIAREDNPGDKYLCCYYTKTSSMNGANGQELGLKSYLEEKLPAFMIPSAFVEVEKFNITSNGKIDRQSLKKPMPNRNLSNVYIAPETKTEVQIAKIWQDVVHIDAIGLTDNFFELGGNSISAMRVIARIADEVGSQISASDFFRNPTIGHIANLISDSSLSTPPVVRKPKQEKYPLTPTQLVFLMIEQFGRGAAYNAKCAYELIGDIDIDALKLAFKRTIDRHQVFRTRFETDGEPCQIFDRENAFNLEVHDFSGEQNADQLADQCLLQLGEKHFSLENDFLFRACLCSLAKDRWVLGFVMPHIISDGWSMSVILRDLIHALGAIKSGIPGQEALPFQYCDYILWNKQHIIENKQLQSEMRSYWLSKITNPLPVLNAYDDSLIFRFPMKLNDGANYFFTIGGEELEQLNKLSAKNGCTLYMTMLSLIKALMFAYSGESDVIVGSPLAGRSRKELENQVGLYINLIALRDRVESNMPFSDLIRSVRQTTIDAYGNQDYPIYNFIEDLELQIDLARNAVFDILVSFHNNEIIFENEPGLEKRAGLEKVNSKRFPSSMNRLDLAFDIKPLDDELEIAIEYNSQLFTAERVVQIADDLKVLVKCWTNNPDQTVESLLESLKASTNR